MKENGNRVKNNVNWIGFDKKREKKAEHILFVLLSVIALGLLCSAVLKINSYGSRINEERETDFRCTEAKSELKRVIREELTAEGYSNAGVMVTEVVEDEKISLNVHIHHHALLEAEESVRSSMIEKIGSASLDIVDGTGFELAFDIQ